MGGAVLRAAYGIAFEARRIGLLAEPRPAGGSDEALLERVRAGDMAAFEVIVRRHRDAALAVARSMVDPITAEDVVADSFERLLMAIRRGRGPRDVVRPYLLRVVRNRAVDVFRQRETPAEFDERDAASTEPQAQVEDRLLVRAAFEELPERWQVVLWMSAVEQCDRHEIASQLGIGPGAVSQLLMRAKEGLRQAYLAQYSSAADPACSEVSELLPPYVRGRASKRETVKVESHLADCERCPAVIGQLGALNRGLGVVLGAAVLGKLAFDAYEAPPAPAVEPVAGRLQGVRTAARVGSLVSAGVAVGALLLATHAGGPTDAGPAPAALGPGRGPATVVVASPRARPSSPRPSVEPPEPSTRASDDPPGSPSASGRPGSSPRGGPTSSAVAPSTPPPSTPPPSDAVVAVGRPVALPRADDVFPVHVTVPVDAPEGVALAAKLTVKGLSAFRVHTDGSYGSWSCSPISDGVLACVLPATTDVNGLGIDLDYTGAPVLRVELAARGSAPDQASGVATLALPRLPR